MHQEKNDKIINNVQLKQKNWNLMTGLSLYIVCVYEGVWDCREQSHEVEGPVCFGEGNLMVDKCNNLPLKQILPLLYITDMF